MCRYFTLIVLVALAACALGKPNNEEMEAVLKKCGEENGIDLESLKGPEKLDHEDRKMKCFGACIMKENGHFNEDGTVNADKAIEHLPPDIPDRERIAGVIKECSTKKGEDDCETAYEIFTCLRENNALPPMHGPHHHHH